MGNLTFALFRKSRLHFRYKFDVSLDLLTLFSFIARDIKTSSCQKYICQVIGNDLCC